MDGIDAWFLCLEPAGRILDATLALSSSEAEAFKARHSDKLSAAPMSDPRQERYDIAGVAISAESLLRAGQADPKVDWDPDDVAFAAKAVARWVLGLPQPSLFLEGVNRRAAGHSISIEIDHPGWINTVWPTISITNLNRLTAEIASLIAPAFWERPSPPGLHQDVLDRLSTMTPHQDERDALYAWLAARAKGILQAHLTLVDVIGGAINIYGVVGVEDVLCIIAGVIRDHPDLVGVSTGETAP